MGQDLNIMGFLFIIWIICSFPGGTVIFSADFTTGEDNKKCIADVLSLHQLCPHVFHSKSKPHFRSSELHQPEPISRLTIPMISQTNLRRRWFRYRLTWIPSPALQTLLSNTARSSAKSPLTATLTALFSSSELSQSGS